VSVERGASADEGAAGWVDVGFFGDGDPCHNGVPGAAAERLGIVEWSDGVLGRLVGPIKDAGFGVEDGDLIGRSRIGGWVRVFEIDPAECLFAAVIETDGVWESGLGAGTFAREPLDPCAVTVEDRDVVVRLNES